MKIDQWRTAKKISQSKLASLLGISGANPARTMQRYESGETSTPTAMLYRLEQLTHGEVTAQDMHEVRLEWLKKNKPEALLPVACRVPA